MRAYLAEPLVGDPPAVLRFKKIARENWGDWPRLKSEAPRGNLRSVLTFLCDHPEDYKRAVNLITPRLLSLWLSAYQSYLWNRAASLLIEKLSEGLQPCESLAFPWGEVRLPVYPLLPDLREKLAALSLPLPAPRVLKSPGGEPLVAMALTQVVEEEGLSLKDLRVRGLKRVYLSGDLRPLWVVPSQPAMDEPEPDEFFPGRMKLTCSFTLPRGSYATLFLRLL
ncbi:tRNA pseudouridine(13) synthase TruD [Candidatus Bipolaricaulota bacterium]|nr:tRNA pseudouridine(13) synthase TruD [Candidatus Bipolaricaulota bacterium]